jgi:hypothetical protein
MQTTMKKSIPNNNREDYEQGLKNSVAHINESNVVTRTTIVLLDCYRAHIAVVYGHFETVYRSHLQGSSSP